MILISKFKDYYDSIAKSYRDTKIVYKRTTSKLFFYKCKELNPSIKASLEFFDRHTVTISSSSSHTEPSINRNLLIIGGKLYPFIERTTSTGTSSYDFKDPYFIENPPPLQISFKYKRNRRLYSRSVNKLQTGEFSERAYSLCQELAPILLFSANHNYVTIDPQIHSLHPPLDPFTVTQDIMSALSSKEPIIPTQDNVTKILAAGFDTKESFRHRNTK